LPTDLDVQSSASLRRHGARSGQGARPGPAPAFAASVLAGLMLAATVLSAPAVRATTYKWVDDQGVVHYTDKMPPEAINKGNTELNKQGVPIKKTEPALTPEQRRAKEAEDERAQQAAKVREEIARKDRALLQSYTTESEIELSKKRALGTIDAQMQSAQAYVTTLNKRKDEIQARIAALNGKPAPPNLEREVTSVNEELEKQADLITTKRKEIAVVTARYDADKQRWRELRQIAEAEAETANAAPAKGTPPPGVNPATVPTSTRK
jgi:flagellar biosynthesis chaperone FliJ